MMQRHKRHAWMVCHPQIGLFIGLAFILSACAGSAHIVVPDALSPSTVKSLAALQDALLVAESADAIANVVSESEAIAPASWQTLEMKAMYANLKGDYQESNHHLIGAILAADRTMASALLSRLNRDFMSRDQERRLLQVLSHKMENLPRGVGYPYAATLFQLSRERLETIGMERSRASLSHILTPWIIGPFDNDQGKGFDVASAPETRGVFSGTTMGSVVDVRWRRPQLSHLGKLTLNEIMSPLKWQTAYAQSEFTLDAGTSLELRISTSDPLKVWVDGQLAFQSRTIGRFEPDNVIVPMKLSAGRHRILVKTMNEKGAWLLRMRLSGDDGASLNATVREIDTITEIQNPSRQDTRLIDTKRIEPTTLYGNFVEAEALYRLHEHKRAVENLQDLHTAHPKSIIVAFAFAKALVSNEERGKASDLLNALEAKHGNELPALSVRLATFWSAQKMSVKGRKLLRKRLKQYPKNLGVALALGRNYKTEGWYEEEARLLMRLNDDYPQVVGLRLRMAQAYKSLKQYPRAEEIYRDLYDVYPGRWNILRELGWLAMGNDRFDEAIEWGQQTLVAHPTSRIALRDLAEAYRRSERYSDAEKILKTAIERNPTAGAPWRTLGRIYLLLGEEEKATAAFREGLDRDPENRKMANRVAWLAPSDDGPWRADVPSDEAINAVIAKRSQWRDGVPGANVVALIDDEVSWLQKDGSTYNIVTYVLHSLNQEGRDEITRMRIRGGGRHQLLNAYAVNSEGQRIEASSIRGRTIRYRQLDVGSTVVLQYRIDSRPEAYLSGHIDRGFWFHSPGTACERGRWVLWVPKDEVVHQQRTDKVQYVETTVGEFRRLEWSADNMPPIVREPSMPPLNQVAQRVSMSTVPTWNVFAEWEKALLVNAYRESPEVREVSRKILSETKTPSEKVRRIHEYVIENIRYQQDYEVTIAGVKPHAAAQVLARQYGDCKDKAVLFIALAKEAGIDVHFASVRTRDRGPIMREVPSQQFNHAIVYVPKQSGISEGRFYDPTVDTLDLDVLRSDDQGTLAYVYDALNKKHYWQSIPFQKPELDHMNSSVVLQLSESGEVKGNLSIGGVGDVGAWLRAQARNPAKFKQSIAQSLVNTTAVSAKVSSVDFSQVLKLDKPVVIGIEYVGTGKFRLEGKEQRWEVPIQATTSAITSVKERKYPFLQGKPRTMRWNVDMQLPKRAKVIRLPESADLKHGCLRYRRDVKQRDGSVRIDQVIQIKCERVQLDDVAAVQRMFSDISRVERGELVLRYGR